MTHPTRFILLCQARTGSTLFGSLLGHHPAICYVGESFKQYRKWRGVKILLRPLISRYPLLRLNWLARQADRPVFGCKLVPHYVRDIQRTIRLAHEHSWLIIHLTRRSAFKTALSLVVSRKTRRHNTGSDNGQPPAPLLTCNPDALTNAIRRVEFLKARQQAALMNIPHLSVSYEDDLANPACWEEATGRIFDQLGLARLPAQTAVDRPWNRPYAEMISNYADLLAHARSNGYGDLLEDAL